jgi:hypothetical protein
MGRSVFDHGGCKLSLALAREPSMECAQSKTAPDGRRGYLVKAGATVRGDLKPK